MPQKPKKQATRLVVRQVTLADHEQVVRLQLECFPGMKPWTLPQWQSMLATFPEGQLGVDMDGEIVASSASLIVDYSEYATWHDWRTVADGGFIRNHDPEGDTLYGIEIQVSPRHRGMKLARRLYEARKRLCRERNLHRIVVGGRIPGYAAVKAEMTAQEYVAKVIRKERHDPVLTTQLSNGFIVEQIIPEYMPSDEDSAGFATCLEWHNLDFVPPLSPRGRLPLHSLAHDAADPLEAQPHVHRLGRDEHLHALRDDHRAPPSGSDTTSLKSCRSNPCRTRIRARPTSTTSSGSRPANKAY